MKKLVLLTVIALSSLNLFSQNFYFEDDERIEETANSEVDSIRPFSIYGLSLGTGINSPVGILGADVELNFYQKHSITAGIGLGSWGYKSTFSFKQYLGGSNKWAMAIGYSHSSGIDELTLEMEPEFLLNQVEPKDVTFKYLSASNLNFSFIYHKKVGKGNNRILFEFGYSAQLNSSRYRILTEDIELNQTGKNLMSIVQPGGLMLAFRYNFGIN
jgi:hypothetical protein